MSDGGEDRKPRPPQADGSPSPEVRDLSPGARFLNVLMAALMAAIGLAGAAFTAFTAAWWLAYLRGPDPFQPEAGSGWFWAILILTVAGAFLPPICIYRVWKRLRRPG